MRGRLLAGVCALVVSASACVTTSTPPPAVVVEPTPAPPPPEPEPEPEPQPEPEPTPLPPVVESGPGVEEGLASYYANRFEGRRTASGERYRKKLATCAHRTHPFGTILVVTNVASGVSATCRVNDRGPWKETRVLDVSRVVAKKLGMLGPGVLTVRVEVQGTAETPADAPATTTGS